MISKWHGTHFPDMVKLTCIEGKVNANHYLMVEYIFGSLTVLLLHLIQQPLSAALTFSFVRLTDSLNSVSARLKP